ncbi:MAG TPA: hypothetical protein PLV43_05080, partial [Aequorivita sp.]|nr:hypothetical protein [Aequorivita sp.]
MQKSFVLILLVIVSIGSTAQVGINTTDPKAQLDIKASNSAAPLPTDGILVPKIEDFPATSPGVDQNGMMVYLVNTVGVYLPGFYYWENTLGVWTPIGNNSNTGWNIQGNANTDETINFIGTKDDQDLVFKRNNIKSGSISASNTSFGIQSVLSNGGSGNNGFGLRALKENISGNSNNAFGKDALTQNVSGSFNSAFGGFSLNKNTASDNSGFGYFTLSNNTTGSANSAFGIGALLNNISGIDNSAFGSYSMVENTTGSSNSAFGRNALRNNTTGNNNVAIGMLALKENTNGKFNVAIGKEALASNTLGNQNTAIGYM